MKQEKINKKSYHITGKEIETFKPRKKESMQGGFSYSSVITVMSNTELPQLHLMIFLIGIREKQAYQT
jgi:hypothetical protein